MGKWRKGYKRPNPERDKIVRNKREKRIIAENREKYIALKKTLSCIRCGESHPACLDFHHRDPATKTKEVSILVWTRNTWKRILREIEKCDVICSNCHRKEHWTEDSSGNL